MFRPILLSLLLGLASNAAAQNWELVWSDEFDVPGAPDPARWDYDLGGHGWGNQELQHYTDRTENARVEDGVLIIEAHREEFGGNAYTSARLVTRGRASWQYGRVETRIKLPFGQGIWPAFWMLPTSSPYGGWPAGGEIDIMEYLGHDTDRVYGTIHYGGGEFGRRSSGGHYDLPTGTFADDFHTFAIEWEPRRMRWYVDGQHFYTAVSWSSAGGPYPAPFDNPFHILLNLAVGGQWPGYPDATTTFPQRMEVDYVRVYADADAYPEVSLDGPSDGTAFATDGTVSLTATASDVGTLNEVAFLQGGGVLGIDKQAPYALDVEGVTDGCYVLRARAVNAAGFVTESEPVSITVGSGCPEGTTSPYLMRPASLPGVVEAEYYDLGGPGVAYSDFSNWNEGSGIRLDEDVDIRPSRDSGGGFDVTNVRAREWLTYTVDVTESGLYRVMGRIASGVGGMLRIAIDGEDLFGDVSLSPTGGDATYANALIGTAPLEKGRRTLRLDMRSAGFSLNRLTFTYLGTSSTDEHPDSGDLRLEIAPNPAGSETRIRYRLPVPGMVEITIFDVLGRQVRTLASLPSTRGEHAVHLDVENLAPGLYLCTLNTESGIRTARLTVVR